MCELFPRRTARSAEGDGAGEFREDCVLPAECCEPVPALAERTGDIPPANHLLVTNGTAA